MASDSRSWRDWSISPGDVLAEALEERTLSQSELARRMGRPLKTINEIVNAKAAVTPDTALQLELVLGIPASLWSGLEANYRQHLAELRVLEEYTQHKRWLQSFPLKDLEQHGFVDRTLPVGQQVAQLLAYFRVGSPEAWQSRWGAMAPAWRESQAHEGSDHARAAWLQWGENLARAAETDPFDPGALRAAALRVRASTRTTPPQAGIDEAQEALREAGVALVVVPEFAGTRLSGAARWLDRESAVVQLSVRHKTDDQLWFSCMHEIGHLLDLPGRDFFDELLIGGAEAGEEAEQRANTYARNALIDPDAYTSFVEFGVYNEQVVREFAADQDVAVGVVVGRLQHDGHLTHRQLSYLKLRITFD